MVKKLTKTQKEKIKKKRINIRFKLTRLDKSLIDTKKKIQKYEKELKELNKINL